MAIKNNFDGDANIRDLGNHHGLMGYMKQQTKNNIVETNEENTPISESGSVYADDNIEHKKRRYDIVHSGGFDVSLRVPDEMEEKENMVKALTDIALKEQQKIREEITKAWESLGIATGISGYTQQNISTLYEQEAKKLFEKEENEDKGSFKDVILPIIRRIK